MLSLKKNLFYSIMLVLANYVFPFLTYPYVSRVLGVTGIGACNFVDSIINYFILFSALGIDSFGVREIARHKDNPEALNRTFSNLFLVNLALTGIMLFSLVVVTFTVPQLSEHKDLMAIGAFKLVFNCLLVEWLFKGLEDFKLISVRSIAVKTLYVVSVFVFVRRQGDVWVYYLLSALMVVANAVVNIVCSRSRVRLVFKNLVLLSTFRSLLALGVYAILTSMYTTFNITFLGFVSGDVEVGYYTTATKIYYLIIAVFAAFTGVMLPRMSTLVANGEMERFKSYFHIAEDVLFGFSLPIIIWLLLLAPDIVEVIAGPEFGGAVVPTMIVAPLIFIIGYEQILVPQTLMPLGKDKLLLRNSLIGAIAGVVLNVALVPVFHAVGSSLVWIITECVILILCQIAVRREIGLDFPFRETGKNILLYVPLALLMAACRLIPGISLFRVVVAMAVAGVYMAVYQIFIRNGELIKALR